MVVVTAGHNHVLSFVSHWGVSPVPHSGLGGRLVSVGTIVVVSAGMIVVVSVGASVVVAALVETGRVVSVFSGGRVAGGIVVSVVGAGGAFVVVPTIVSVPTGVETGRVVSVLLPHDANMEARIADAASVAIKVFFIVCILLAD